MASRILKHDYITLNFLLEVSPTPDIITRVFVLFTPVCGDELVEWEGAFGSVGIWKEVVGCRMGDVDEAKAKGGGVGWKGGWEVIAQSTEMWDFAVCYLYFYEMGEVPSINWRGGVELRIIAISIAANLAIHFLNEIHTMKSRLEEVEEVFGRKRKESEWIGA
ncbi:hypothetical protein EDD18DRAFT_1420114 [Armillaria luteobubalina]|uniref:Uncharacterized protein n=1 Tax=Armillaria luteobubalina TaxID=153913 RepID=A0AA39PRC4_9AGAR|nr:hypothetical protein EDD18DRAFT_1420114 [Armillaria luteobubalina]